MKRPVRPVGAPDSRNREGLTAASFVSVRRMVEEFNGVKSWIERVMYAPSSRGLESSGQPTLNFDDASRSHYTISDREACVQNLQEREKNPISLHKKI